MKFFLYLSFMNSNFSDLSSQYITFLFLLLFKFTPLMSLSTYHSYLGFLFIYQRTYTAEHLSLSLLYFPSCYSFPLLIPSLPIFIASMLIRSHYPRPTSHPCFPASSFPYSQHPHIVPMYVYFHASP